MTTENIDPDGFVAGVDGCRGGWLVVIRPVTRPAAASMHVVATFAEVLASAEQAQIIAVDMPIGLPDIAGPGGRAADSEARSRLGQRQSSVFSVPSRAAIAATDYRTACDIALRQSVPPRKIAKQSFNIFPKIREIDALMSPTLQRRVVEVHPELAFWALNDEQPVALPKKVKSRPFADGLELRRRLLAQAGYDREFLCSHGLSAAVAGPDDLLDATACAWTAARIALGRAGRCPALPSLDSRGLRMEIWY